MSYFDLINTISVAMDDGAEITVFIYGPTHTDEALFDDVGILKSAPPIVMLHGNGESHLNMMHLIEGAATDHAVIAIDSRGHGESTRGKSALSYDRMSKDVLEVLEYVNIPHVHLMGFSDGGIVAIKVGLASSNRILSMTIMGANLEPSGLRSDFIDQIAAELKELESFEEPEFQDTKYSQAELYSLMLREPYISVFKLRSITCPVAVMAGQYDLVLLEETYRIAEALPNASMTIVKGVGHDLPNEAPDEVLREAAVAVAEGEQFLPNRG